HYQTIDISPSREDYPFDELPGNFTMLLGAKDPQVATRVGEAIYRAVMTADAKLPGLEAQYHANYIEENTTNIPEDLEPRYRDSYLGQVEQRYVRSRLTGIAAIMELVNGLAYGLSVNAQGYASASLAFQKGLLLKRLLAEVKWPDLKADVANAAIGYYV